MIDIVDILYNKVKAVIMEWETEPDVYAISFFVESNEEYRYAGFSNISEFAISYNAESDCEGAGKYDEERWNYAFWRQDETFIIDSGNANEEIKLLFEWYKENHIDNIGYEDEECYNENGEYIGKGPVGHYELLTVAAKVARRLQEQSIILEKYGKPIPIIVHGLEYSWYDIEATRKANPNDEAKDFIEAYERNFE